MKILNLSIFLLLYIGFLNNAFANVEEDSDYVALDLNQKHLSLIKTKMSIEVVSVKRELDILSISFRVKAFAEVKFLPKIKFSKKFTFKFKSKLCKTIFKKGPVKIDICIRTHQVCAELNVFGKSLKDICVKF